MSELHLSMEDLKQLQANLDCKEYEGLLKEDEDEKFRLLACIECEQPLLEYEYRYCYECKNGLN